MYDIAVSLTVRIKRLDIVFLYEEVNNIYELANAPSPAE